MTIGVLVSEVGTSADESSSGQSRSAGGGAVIEQSINGDETLSKRHQFLLSMLFAAIFVGAFAIFQAAVRPNAPAVEDQPQVPATPGVSEGHP